MAYFVAAEKKKKITPYLFSPLEIPWIYGMTETFLVSFLTRSALVVLP